jgi:DNA helicase HerA-like ATPase
LNDLLAVDAQGRGNMNILMANELIQRPRLYACFLLWLLAELFEDLPEVGDLPQPKLVLFFDEAHLLFDNAPKILLEKVEQVVRLIRSKGVGVYFVTQNPGDIPEEIQGQLGNRIQHALRAFTPTELKKVKAAADSLRANPAFDTVKTLGELGVGEALVSTLDEKGIPAIVERAKVRLPESRLGPLQPMERTQLMMASPYGAKYGMVVDRQSAYETLQTQKAANNNADRVPVMKKTGRPRDSMAEAIAKSAVRAASSSIGRQIGNQIIRGVLGAILKR